MSVTYFSGSVVAPGRHSRDSGNLGCISQGERAGVRAAGRTGPPMAPRSAGGRAQHAAPLRLGPYLPWSSGEREGGVKRPLLHGRWRPTGE